MKRRAVTFPKGGKLLSVADSKRITVDPEFMARIVEQIRKRGSGNKPKPPRDWYTKKAGAT